MEAGSVKHFFDIAIVLNYGKLLFFLYFSDAEYSAILSNIKDRLFEREKESYIMSKNTPFRYDYVGSFLRPETLTKARKDFEEGKI